MILHGYREPSGVTRLLILSYVFVSCNLFLLVSLKMLPVSVIVLPGPVFPSRGILVSLSPSVSSVIAPLPELLQAAITRAVLQMTNNFFMSLKYGVCETITLPFLNELKTGVNSKQMLNYFNTNHHEL